MKSLLATASLLTAILMCSHAQAQVGTNPMSLGMSPPAVGGGAPSMPAMSAGPNSLVGPVGVPLGSTELAVPGLSPAPTPIPGCPTTTMSGSQMSGSQAGTTPFDGGGLTSMSANCPALGDSGLSADQTQTTQGMPSLSTGRTGIPLGSTEILNPGLSPPPPPTPLLSATPQFSPGPTSPMAGPSMGGSLGGNP